MKISIRDYRGVERADIELDRIALIAGRNEQGKTCVLEAARAALCGMAIPIPGVLKKDAKLLVRDGAESGQASAGDGEPGRTVHWPSATVLDMDTESTGPIKCTDYASGFRHFWDNDAKTRASVLAMYIDSTPTKENIEAAAYDAGYQDSAIAKIWESVRDDGWDATYGRARDYTIKLKGQWEEATGEKYGAKKAAEWHPAVFGSDDQPVDLGCGREALVEKANAAEQAVLNMAGAAAVSDAEIERLNRQVEAANESEDRIKLNDKLVQPRDQLDKAKAERLTIPDDSKEIADPAVPCPECGALLTVSEYGYEVGGDPPTLKPYVKKEFDPAAVKAAGKQRAFLDGTIKRLTDEIAGLEGRITTSTALIATWETAKKRLEEIKKAPKLDEVAIQKVKDDLSHAQALVLAFDAKIRADKLHGDLLKNEKLIAILAPDGLRRRKLVAKLDEFNTRLAKICASAAWPVVRLDEKLEGHYGTRPVWAASNSGQWRARAVLQIAFTQIDGSAAVLLDEADILDKRGRNGLFKALEVADVRALVCMTFSKPEQVPDLAAAGLGRSYWIESGIAEAING